MVDPFKRKPRPHPLPYSAPLSSVLPAGHWPTLTFTFNSLPVWNNLVEFHYKTAKFSDNFQHRHDADLKRFQLRFWLAI